jgi:hypothetical protein
MPGRKPFFASANDHSFGVVSKLRPLNKNKACHPSWLELEALENRSACGTALNPATPPISVMLEVLAWPHAAKIPTLCLASPQAFQKSKGLARSFCRIPRGLPFAVFF